MHSCIPHTTFSKAGATTLRKGSKWVAKLVEAVSLAVQELQKGNERREEKRREEDTMQMSDTHAAVFFVYW
jgi:hypothetical protein